MKNEKFDVVELLGKPALFTNARLKSVDVPPNVHLYHLRERGGGAGFASLERWVGVNHGGSILSKEPIDLGPDGYISFKKPDEGPNFAYGGKITLQEYLNGDFEMNGGPEKAPDMSMNM
jgi:hypothetical protein